jgi:pimeloyl-ACP methyl ester carboxylesterase
MTMHTFEHDGIALAAYRDGTIGGYPVLLLHGLSGAACSYDELVGQLDPALEIHRLDFRGHGDSARAPGTYDVPRLVADVVAYIRTAVNRPVFLVGHSLGGVVAHVVAQRHPDLVVAAFEEDPPLYFCDHSLFEQSMFAMVFPMIAGQIRDVQANNVPFNSVCDGVRNAPTARGGISADDMNETNIASRAREMMGCDPSTIDTAVTGGLLMGYDPDEPVTVPLTVLRADPALGAALPPDHAARVAASQPHATIIEVANATHLIHSEIHTSAAYTRHLQAAIDRAFSTSS